MSKSILVIDTPTCCLMCECVEMKFGKNRCQAVEESLKEEDVYDRKPEWCPLKPVPEKNNIKRAATITSLTWIEGWNACVDEILKE